MPTIKISLSSDSVDSALKQLRDYQKRIENAGGEIAQRLAQKGYEVAFREMDGHVYTGETIGNLEVVQVDENKFVLRTTSSAILFFEFGAGIRYGSGHPKAGEFGFGPGTYPGKGHWDDPNGWWYETDDPNLTQRTGKDGKAYAHTYGSKPHMPFYKASVQMREDLLKVAKEVLSGG